MNYRYGSHMVYQIECHFVWVSKYRYKVLQGEVALRVRELVRQTGTSKNPLSRTDHLKPPCCQPCPSHEAP